MLNAVARASSDRSTSCCVPPQNPGHPPLRGPATEPSALADPGTHRDAATGDDIYSDRPPAAGRRLPAFYTGPAAMKANETKLQPLIEGTKQYVVPLFQRPYTWEKRHWQTLWRDIQELLNDPGDKSHFMGAIVTMP